MDRRLRMIVVAAVATIVAALIASSLPPRPRSLGDDPRPRVVLVTMWDRGGVYRFRPAEVRVRRGDRVRFVLDGRAAHNVEFPSRARAPDRAAAPMIGPYVTRRDQVYEVLVDDAFADGVHPFHCPPHEPFGMRGRLVVAGDARPW